MYALHLADGRRVVLKSRRDDSGRARACVDAQGAMADDGFACARPITPVDIVDGQAVHVEEYLPGGEIETDDGPRTGAAFAAVFADLLGRLAALAPSAPATNPDWMRWSGPVAFPRLWWQEWWVDTAPLPSVILETAERVRRRLAAGRFPAVLGHADWETQNLRWSGGSLHAVHDWDSLASLPECTLVGTAAGTFASNRIPTLAPMASSAAFLDSYQRHRGRTFGVDEEQCAWAASLWPACFNARIQVLYDRPRPALDQLAIQAAERLALAGA